jgi:hypothetical protein
MGQFGKGIGGKGDPPPCFSISTQV